MAKIILILMENILLEFDKIWKNISWLIFIVRKEMI